MKVHWLLVFVVGLSLNIAYADQKPQVPKIIAGAMSVTAEEVVALILAQPDLVVIDARKKTEYLKGRIEGAINLLNTQMNQQALTKIAPNKSQSIVFYCNGLRCLRSSDAVKKAVAWGYTNIFWFRGGWKEWTEKRLPVISG